MTQGSGEVAAMALAIEENGAEFIVALGRADAPAPTLAGNMSSITAYMTS